MRLLVCVALLASAVWAGERSDRSLAREVDRYLEKSATKWDDASTLRPHWKEALMFETADGAFQFHVRGRIQWDTLWARSEDSFTGPTLDNASYFRRLRLGVEGRAYTRTVFSVEIDFAGGAVTPRNVYVGLRKIFGLATLLLGHFKEPFTLQDQTSSRFLNTMERSVAVNAFAPGYNTGLGIFTPWLNKRMTFGLFWGYTADDSGSFTGNGGGAFTFRVAGIVIENQTMRSLFHFGLDVSYRDHVAGTGFSSRAADAPGAGLVSIALPNAESDLRYAIEAALVLGPVDIMAEYIVAKVDDPSTGDPSFHGWYVQLGWFATGESRPYRRTRGSFGRVTPKRNFLDGSGGYGALQIVLRLDGLKLEDQAANGGKLQTLLAGLNWHWNPNTRTMFNVVFADVENGPFGTGEHVAFQVRVAFDF
ncbi:MAG: OprO/OprP family phosphate-selective porin [Planctomycetota bacterium]|jgi:phosphate-selective porin OprO/OprP